MVVPFLEKARTEKPRHFFRTFRCGHVQEMRKLKGAETVFWPSSGGTGRSLRPLTAGGSLVPGRRLGVGALCGRSSSRAEQRSTPPGVVRGPTLQIPGVDGVECQAPLALTTIQLLEIDDDFDTMPMS
ncbi:hypothetical protein Cadr_000010732 [Camelus dromedarius]|uniref:Uncharacterized protein n=1 Tax=Camelus dromedarius TaxID=9838 RepID=A0A5N4DQF7_CAMDR|nr:hypothetical protein Cadr_000010732 [Camelus dromedarius]